MSDKKNEPIVLHADSDCLCGQRMPWHLAEVGAKRFNCFSLDGPNGCGRSWDFSSDGGTATLVTDG